MKNSVDEHLSTIDLQETATISAIEEKEEQNQVEKESKAELSPTDQSDLNSSALSDIATIKHSKSITLKNTTPNIPAKEINENPYVLDLATGTGDVAIEIAHHNHLSRIISFKTMHFCEK